MEEDDVVPLCRTHHGLYDDRSLDLLPYLTVDEQALAVKRAKGLVNAYDRITARGGNP
jgi:hypothetical protein